MAPHAGVSPESSAEPKPSSRLVPSGAGSREPPTERSWPPRPQGRPPVLGVRVGWRAEDRATAPRLPSVTRWDVGVWRGSGQGGPGRRPHPRRVPRAQFQQGHSAAGLHNLRVFCPRSHRAPAPTRAQAAPCPRVGGRGEGLLRPAGESGPAGAWSQLAGPATHSTLETDLQGGRREVRLFRDRDPGHGEDTPRPCWGLRVLLREARATGHRERRSPGPPWSGVSRHRSRCARPRQGGRLHLLVLRAWGQFGDQPAVLVPLLRKLYGLKDKERSTQAFCGCGEGGSCAHPHFPRMQQGCGRWRWGLVGEGQGQGQRRCWDLPSAPQVGAGCQDRCCVTRKASGPEWAPWCPFPRPLGPTMPPKAPRSGLSPPHSHQLLLAALTPHPEPLESGPVPVLALRTLLGWGLGAGSLARVPQGPHPSRSLCLGFLPSSRKSHVTWGRVPAALGPPSQVCRAETGHHLSPSLVPPKPTRQPGSPRGHGVTPHP